MVSEGRAHAECFPGRQGRATGVTGVPGADGTALVDQRGPALARLTPSPFCI